MDSQIIPQERPRRIPRHDKNATERCCSRCKSVKPLSEYKPVMAEKRRHLLMSWCIECEKLRREKYKSNRTRKPEYYRDESFIRTGSSKHGWKLRPQAYQRMLESQNGGCDICGTLEKDRRLSVDHCHVTGKIRALLCRRCNTGIGFFQEDIDLLEKAIQYLKHHNAHKQ